MGENREYLTQSASDGSINISEDVVVAIASEAIGEIEGVGAMMTTMTEQLTEQFMGKKPARGIRMDIQDGEITLDVYLTVKYGFAIPETAAKVQDAVMSAVETMTGFSVRRSTSMWAASASTNKKEKRTKRLWFAILQERLPCIWRMS